MQARVFNDIYINRMEGCLTKTSTHLQKIKDEIKYYLDLPSSISHFFPKLIDYNKDYSGYKMEYIPFKTLSELLVEEKLTIKEGKIILTNIFKILDKLHILKPKKNEITSDHLLNFYIGKTLNRIEELNANFHFQDLINQSKVMINGIQYKTFKMLKENFINAIEGCIHKHSCVTAIHGDFCFSNILYCPKSKKIKLIDPRGSFGSQGIFGDPYYDYAKLLHCVHGQYDHMVHHQYKLYEEKPGEFILEKPLSSVLENLHKSCREILKKRGINLSFIYLIEASLFLSMASLHYEDLSRQKALFLTGIIMLNDFFEGKNENLY